MLNIHIHHHHPELEDLGCRMDALTEAVRSLRRIDIAVFESVYALSNQLNEIANNSGDYATLKAAIEQKATELNRSSDALAKVVKTVDEALSGATKA